MQRAAGYFRVSSRPQAGERNVSLAVQRDRFNTYCLTHDLAPAGEFTDVLSGRRDDRREYQQMLAAARSGEFSSIVVMFLDRFGRSAEEIMFQVLALRRENIEVRCTDENIDDFIRLALSSWKAGEESSRTGERVRAAALRKVRAGNRWGKVPYGYRQVSDGSVEIDPDTSEALRFAARLLLDENLGLRQAALRLNEHGYRRRHGGLWDASTLHGKIVQETLTGTVTFARPGGKANPDGAKEHARAENVLPAIFSIETIEKLRERFTTRRTEPKGRSQASPFLLTGLLRCGLCEGRMHGGHSGKYRLAQYRCGTHAQRMGCQSNVQNAQKTETAVLSELLIQADAQLAAERLNELAASIPEQQNCVAERIGLQRRLNTLKDEFLKAFRAYTAGIIDDGALKLANTALREEQISVEQRLTALDAAEQVERQRLVQRAAVPALLASLHDEFETLTVLQRKALLRQLVARILVWPDHHIAVHLVL